VFSWISGCTEVVTMPYPVTVTVQPQAGSRNRLTTAFRPILAIPHTILAGPIYFAPHTVGDAREFSQAASGNSRRH
jgi:hypothetical protein